MSLAHTLAEGLRRLDLDVSDDARQRLLDYVALLTRWNRAYNLTAVRDPEQMVVRHLLDSLAVLPHVEDGELLDVGTGAGLPGIPLAICRPDLRVTLLDSNGKKVRFVRQAIMALHLANADVVQSRVEQYRNAISQVITRAFASLPDIVALAAPALAPGGRLLAMKGALTGAEMAGVQPPWRAAAHALQVPFLDEPRQLVILTREGGTP